MTVQAFYQTHEGQYELLEIS